MPRQLRFRFSTPKDFPPARTWAICEAGGYTPFAVIQLDDRNRVVRGPGSGIYYATTLEAARGALPPDLLRIADPPQIPKLAAAFGRVLEIWF